VRRLRPAVLAQLCFVLVVFTVLFAMHSRWIFVHFSSDAYLEDSGWLAYLFESRDPLLHNPLAENDLSFYAHHLSPHIFLFGAPLSKLFGLTGIQIFACHQGLFFGLLFVAVCGMVTRSGLPRRDQAIAATAAVLLGALSNAALQAAAYPHDEIAMIALAVLAMAAWLGHHRRLFALCVIWLPLVREDGGFYVAVVCLSCAIVERDPGQPQNRSARLLLVLALAGLFASAGSFAIKAWFFPGFDAFAKNFAGGKNFSPAPWSHLTTAFVLERVRAMLQNVNIVPVLAGSAVLAAFDRRYLTGVVLLSPIYLIHLIALRPEHGHFTLYFALPWLLPPAIWLAVFVRRSSLSRATLTETVVILGAALVLSAPVQAAARVPTQSWYVAEWAFRRPVEDIRQMQDFVRWVRKGFGATEGGRSKGKHCVSQGIAALVPNEIRPEEVLAPAADLRACEMLLLMRGEMDYAEIGTRGREAGFEQMLSRGNAEVWVVRRASMP
jgi:hypothetical protein